MASRNMGIRPVGIQEVETYELQNLVVSRRSELRSKVVGTEAIARPKRVAR